MPSLPPLERLTRFKEKLQTLREELIALHREEKDVERVVRTTAEHMDRLLLDAWDEHFEQANDITMVAVGGYGRRELNIHSDIDLLFLHSFAQPVEQALEQAGITTFIQFLWDIGLEVGQSVRTVDECLEQANQDITIMTNLLESRYLAGDSTRYQTFADQIRGHTTWTDKSFYRAKYQEQVERHERFDETTYKLEPNIKKSPGGLRDIQTISWIANKIYGTSDPDSLMSLGLLTAEELKLFKSSRNTLWALRNALHIQAGRSEDRLLFAYQQEIARSYGLADRPGLLAIEQLMRKYYRAAQDIKRLNEFILQLIDESLDDDKSAHRIELDKNFYIQSGYLSTVDADVFQRDPDQLLRVFSLFQHHHHELKGFSANCVRAIREARPLIDKTFRNKRENLDAFLGLFKHATGLTHTLRKMHQFGVLGAFLPVFGKIEGQMQHDLFHAYTVDAHTLMVIRNLRRCSLDKFAHELPDITELAQRTDDLYRIYLAAIFHDIAKGRGGNHDVLGAVDARNYCAKLGLAEEDVELISWLVLNHLKMSVFSQREDLTDPEVIQRFAELVGTQERLDNLYLLTVADIRGTSAATWTAWKGHLLRQLHERTSALLRERSRDQAPGPEGADPDAELREKRERTYALLENQIPEAPLDRYWSMLDADYFLMYRPDTIAWHAQVICRASALDLPLVEVRYIADLEAEQYLIYTADSDVLLSTVTAVIEHLGQNIVQARIHAANPGFTVLIFTVTSEDGAPDDKTLDTHTGKMRTALLEAREHRPPVKKLVPRRLRQFSIEPSVNFSATHDEQLTMMNITALDQPGLIHLIATIMAECRIRLISAHITTAGEKAEDRFIVSQPNTRRALTKKQMKCLRNGLIEALQ